MFTETRNLLKDHGGLIFAAFLLFFFSIFGQSAFFGAYLPDIQAALGLSKTETGSLYSAATVLSAIVLIFTGRLVDTHRLRHVLAGALIGLAAGCFMLAGAVNAFMLFIAFFILRQCGQGLMVHSGITAVNRYLETGRGKAMGMISQGGPFHIIVFPPLALWLAHYLDWRTAWVAYGVFILAVLLPGFWFYLRRHQSTTHALWERRQQAAIDIATDSAHKQWTRRHVLRDWRFYGLCAILCIPAFVGTILFFYQHDMALALGVSPLTYASAMAACSLAMIGFNFCGGYMIDRYGEKPVIILFTLTYTVGIAAMTFLPPLAALYTGLILMCGAGAALGTAGGPVIVQLYGTQHLGAIKSMLFSANVMGAAASPVLFGFLMDRGYDITTILSWVAFYTGTIWVLALPVFATLKK